MATYVLVHGAWHGGWCWRRLRDAGHEVFTPTLTGLGERAHLLTPEVGLRTHVDDVVGVLRYEDLRDVVLVGHSYAGFVVREAADRVPDRVAEIVLLDAWVGRDGESMDTRTPEWFLTWVDAATDGGVVAAPRAASVGVSDPGDVAWLEPLLTPHPRRSFTEPTRLTGAVDAVPCRAVVCIPGGGVPFAAWVKEFGWECAELEYRRAHRVAATPPTSRVRHRDRGPHLRRTADPRPGCRLPVPAQRGGVSRGQRALLRAHGPAGRDRTDLAAAVGGRPPSRFVGRYWSLTDLDGFPRPARPGGPALWFAGAGSKSLARVGEIFDGWLPYPPEVERIVRRADRPSDRGGVGRFDPLREVGGA